MPTFKTKEKIKSTEIRVPEFEEANFIISPDYKDKTRHTVTTFCYNSPAGNNIQGESSPFTLGKKTVIIAHCKKAYVKLIKNVEKFVEENEPC